MASLVQVFITLGIMLGYFVCYGTINVESSLSWRLPLAIQAGIALSLAVIAGFYLPHSPRWLSFKGRKQEATAIWDKLGVSSAEREKDLEQSTNPGGEGVGAAEVLKRGLKDRITQSVANSMAVFGKTARRPMLLGVFMMSMQQLSGIDGVMYVSADTKPFGH